jgi:hypothetical protein
LTDILIYINISPVGYKFLFLIIGSCMSALEKLSITIAEKDKVSLTDAIKSVVRYDNRLDSNDIERVIEALVSSKLFEPILAYYALSSLQNQNPINIYNVFSDEAIEMGKSIAGLAHYDGKIGLKSFPITRDVAENITKKLFNFIEHKTEFTVDLFEQAASIYLSEAGLPQKLKTQQGFSKFISYGLFGHDESVLFHEITHQVMREVFQYPGLYFDNESQSSMVYKSCKPYFNNNTKSEDDYHLAICALPHQKTNY